MFFRKKPDVPICRHAWELIDYCSYVDISLEIEKEYTLGCIKCNREKVVDEYDYAQMLHLGLIKSWEDSE